MANGSSRSIRGRREVSIVRGLALEATGSIDDAIKAYQEVLAVAPRPSPAQAKLARCIWPGATSGTPSSSRSRWSRHSRGRRSPFLYAKALLKTGDLAERRARVARPRKGGPIIRGGARVDGDAATKPSETRRAHVDRSSGRSN